jgi:hypothetical protein
MVLRFDPSTSAAEVIVHSVEMRAEERTVRAG